MNFLKKKAVINQPLLLGELWLSTSKHNVLILFSLTNFGFENCFIIRFDPYCPHSKWCQLEHRMMSDKGYGMHSSHSIYHPLCSYLTLTFQRKTSHLLCHQPGKAFLHFLLCFWSREWQCVVKWTTLLMEMWKCICC